MAFLGVTHPVCPGCSSFLIEPYVGCLSCQAKTHICVSCFAKGWEGGSHENNHNYEIVTNDFPVLDSLWTAREEMKLLEALSDHGYGNWHDVSNHLPNRTKQECEAHYSKVYLNNTRTVLPTFTSAPVKKLKPIPCRACEDPPRPIGDSQRSADMAGYMPARSDYTKEYDNGAEWDIKDIYFQGEEEQLLTELKYAAVDIYYNRLRERHNRKRTIRDYGLLSIHKHHIQERNHDLAVRNIIDKLRKFSRLQTPLAHDKLVEGLVYELDLRKEIKRLQEYRSQGNMSFSAARMYDKLKLRREPSRLKKRTLLSRFSPSPAVPPPVNSGCIDKLWCSRSSTPLDLTSYAGYDRLNDKEKTLCANVRILPEAFFEYKRIFQSECAKLGHLKLKQARNLIRIDVNKIRKVFDFLVKEGHINTS
ncbi:putative transcriptional adapter 2-alpha isoform X2 [Apostichopus japonicus]|uniref:Transcriptional adapter n=1 Tax=Stichopus japonicus TaxID=307972 RepID=A0A2G8KX88_STIJA|nr:putative transcriptional adapter 2-alpha isoform X2 [Apostichopus japonicus]